jgi:hypothetical protein
MIFQRYFVQILNQSYSSKFFVNKALYLSVTRVAEYFQVAWETNDPGSNGIPFQRRNQEIPVSRWDNYT